jgi:hypothetical protein
MCFPQPREASGSAHTPHAKPVTCCLRGRQIAIQRDQRQRVEHASEGNPPRDQFGFFRLRSFDSSGFSLFLVESDYKILVLRLRFRGCWSDFGCPFRLPGFVRESAPEHPGKSGEHKDYREEMD